MNMFIHKYAHLRDGKMKTWEGKSYFLSCAELTPVEHRVSLSDV